MPYFLVMAAYMCFFTQNRQKSLNYLILSINENTGELNGYIPRIVAKRFMLL